MKKCRICGREVRARGLCKNHYSQLNRYGKICSGIPQPWKLSNRKCKIEGCNREHYAKGYCRKHYERFITNGGYKLHKCKIKSCSKMIYSKSMYCEKHRYRIKHNLPLDLSIKCFLKGKRNPNWRGGVAEYPNHYLMKKNRLIILMQNPKCEYCGKPATEVHHKDENKSNHKLSNLTATCHKCNTKQSSKFYKRFGYTFDEITEKLSFTNLSRSYWQRHPSEINHYLLDTQPKVC